MKIGTLNAGTYAVVAIDFNCVVPTVRYAADDVYRSHLEIELGAGSRCNGTQRKDGEEIVVALHSNGRSGVAIVPVMQPKLCQAITTVEVERDTRQEVSLVNDILYLGDSSLHLGELAKIAA